MRVAALDLGSNSFHLLVADVHPDRSFTTVTREKEMLRLGDEVAKHGRIRPAAADRAVACARRLRELALANGAIDVEAVATAAIRAAENGSELVDRLAAEAGLHVRVIDGVEEARLVYEAVRASIEIDPGPAVGLDLGGGSLEVWVGHRDQLLDATSLHLGVGVLRTLAGDEDPIRTAAIKVIANRVDDDLGPIAEQFDEHEPTTLIGTSGTFGDLVAMTCDYVGRPVSGRRNHLAITRAEFDDFYADLVRMTASERRLLPGLEEKRVDLIVPGAVVLHRVFRRFEIDTFTYSDWALREGILLDAVGRASPDAFADDNQSVQRASVGALARRCRSNLEHCANVLHVAHRLFDQLEPLHELDKDDRLALEHAVRLHDIGQHVSHERHHEHAAYLVEHGALRGFDHEQIAFLAAMVRHHRRGEPKPSEPRFAALSPRERARMRKIVAILRVADGLDRGRRQRVHDIDVADDGEVVHLTLHAESDPELEIWGARRRAALFETVFRRRLAITVDPH